MCELCGGAGFRVLDVPLRDPRFGQAIPCACQAEKSRMRAMQRLETLDGLTASERGHRFETTKDYPTQNEARLALSNAFAGIYVLQGPPGTGKSHMLHCTVNKAKIEGRAAVYSTMTDVLDYLRETFNPKNDEQFTDRWKLLCECDVLALDELDEFNATDWARERFLRLIDERWRNRDSLLTLVALNGDLRTLMPKVASRLMQGRVLVMRSADMRTVFRQREAVLA